jgi:hypothetical protein
MATEPLVGKPLVRQAWALFMRDPSMIVLLVIGGMAAGAAFLLVVGPAELMLGTSLETSSNPVSFAVLAVALLASTFVSTFFTGAVVGAAMERADGGDPDVSSALAAAWARRGPLLAWAAFATAVGLALRALERWGVAGLLVRVLAGTAWTVGTWFAVPVIMAEGTMPIDTVRRSVDVLSARFGTNVRATVRFGIEWLLVYVGIVAVGLFGVVVLLAGVSRHQAMGLVLGGILVVAAVVGMFVASAFQQALSAYLRTVLYRYATDLPIPGISTGALPPMLPAHV